MKILGLDLESTGVSIKTVGVVEVGIVEYDTALRMVTKLMGFLVNPGDILWEPDIEKIHGITPAMTVEYGIPNEKALKQTLHWMQSVDYIAAHNGLTFDKIMLEEWASRFGFTVPALPWIDTMLDIDLPLKSSNRLSYMAADHGFVNPFPHRAAFDVLTMLRIMESYDFELMFERAKSPAIEVEALVSFQDKDLAKNRGYYWKGETKQWLKRMRLVQVSEEENRVPFKVKVISKI
jgi:DNA polymerase III subunit epsilon